ncbi:hypothetical protein Nepgr_012549 [Nepenthes gracilis]|uniref:Uncharacterized protein n=1 Tax=Nepenthes gracilis TaxID=150966 RepID=A0AAD3XN68_NEPGR|nr:hypothetical protein Nepgr_012549 [Nepenthes gracilis]
MHVSALDVDINWFVQFVFATLVVALGLLHLLKNTASKYFIADANFDSSDPASSSSSSLPPPPSSLTFKASSMGGVTQAMDDDRCALCRKSATKKCSRCKAVWYCSQTCQVEHWKSEHKRKCKESELSGVCGKRNTSIKLVPSSGSCKMQKQPEKVLFPYDEFVKLFTWDNPGFPPCGLLNCGNSCFANVVLQCLVHTRPLLAYLLEKGHRRGCRRNEWCFFCELQTHAERASQSQHPFSPINILSRLPSLGGNLGYGKQEDAHEFMRFAVDTMQSLCLDECGGEKLLHPKSQETTLIQHIFGGQLQSQVICTQCNQVSNQFENMMDLTVEIQGDATSLEECLEQFAAKEWLHGDNMYKCDRCNDYVKAWKCLTIHQAPNILTIALKRFQSGRFGKLNKRITFPGNLDLSPYMSEEGDGTDKYQLYAVVVHVDMLNASFFGHYICYTKDFHGNWYRIDDCKVMRVELDEVLWQGAYMLLYSRVSARPTCLGTFQSQRKNLEKVNQMPSQSEMYRPKQKANSSNSSELINPSPSSDMDCLPSDVVIPNSSGIYLQFLGQDEEEVCTSYPGSTSPVSTNIEVHENEDTISDRMPFAEHTHGSISSSDSSLSERPSSGDCGVISGASTHCFSVNGICFQEIGPLASSTGMASTSDELTPVETSPLSSSSLPVSEMTSEELKSENNLPIFSSTDISENMEKAAEIPLLHAIATAHKPNGYTCNGFGDHASGILDSSSIVEGQRERYPNAMEMDDVESSGSVNIQKGQANCSGQDFSSGKMDSCEPGQDSYIGDGSVFFRQIIGQRNQCSQNQNPRIELSSSFWKQWNISLNIFPRYDSMSRLAESKSWILLLPYSCGFEMQTRLQKSW